MAQCSIYPYAVFSHLRFVSDHVATPFSSLFFITFHQWSIVSCHVNVISRCRYTYLCLFQDFQKFYSFLILLYPDHYSITNVVITQLKFIITKCTILTTRLHVRYLWVKVKHSFLERLNNICDCVSDIEALSYFFPLFAIQK